MERVLFEGECRRVMRRRLHETIKVVASVLLSGLVAGCGEMYCQSGPKYGTQCYDLNAIEWQETQVRGETISERYARGPSHPSGGEPIGPEAASPGCVVPTTSSGVYVMSGACTTRREQAPGAVR